MAYLKYFTIMVKNATTTHCYLALSIHMCRKRFIDVKTYFSHDCNIHAKVISYYIDKTQFMLSETSFEKYYYCRMAIYHY